MLPTRRRERLRRLIIASVVVSVPLALGIGFWFGTPYLVETKVHQGIVTLGQATDSQIEVGSVEYQRFDRVVLRDVTVKPKESKDSEAPIATIEQVDVLLDGVRLLSGKARLTEVKITGPKVALIRRANGTDNFESIKNKVLRILEGRGASDGASGGRSKIWDVVDKHIPHVAIVGGTLEVKDLTEGHTLIPPELPQTLTLNKVSLTANNNAPLAEDLVLEVESSAHAPLIAGNLDARLEYNGRTKQLAMSVKTSDSVQMKVGDKTISAGGIAWNLGGQIRLSTVKVGDAFKAGEIVVSFHEKGAETRVNNPGNTVEALLARVRKMTFEYPTVNLAQSNALSDKVKQLLAASPASNSETQDALPSVEDKKVEKKKRRIRPKLKKKGAKVRKAMAAAYEKLAAKIERSGAVLRTLTHGRPVPEIVVRGGVIELGERTDLPNALKDIGQFDLNFQRNAERVNLVVSFSQKNGGGASTRDTFTVRVQTATGDLQIRAVASRFALARVKSFLPKSVRAGEGAHLTDTDLTVLMSPKRGHVEVHGRIHVDGLTVDAPILSSDPLKDVRVGGVLNGRLDLNLAELSLADSEIHWGDAVAKVTMDVSDMAAAPLLKWSLEVPRGPLQEIVDGFPVGFLGKLEGLKMAGEYAWKLTGKLDTRNMQSLHYSSRADTWGVELTNMGKHVDFVMLTKPFTHRIQESGSEVQEMVTGPKSRNYTGIHKISPLMEKVLTTTEDGTFWRHKGTAWFAIKDAIIRNLETGRFARGGSTITMQLVKNIFLIREKTISRKAQEMFLAWQIEKYLTKQRILELYLNIVELGPGVYGIKKAAKHYFDKTPSELGLVECAFLGSILPNPRRYHYQFTRGKVTESWRQGLRKTIEVMFKRGKISETMRADASPYSPRFRKR